MNSDKGDISLLLRIYNCYPQAEKPAAQTAHLFFANAQFQRSKK